MKKTVLELSDQENCWPNACNISAEHSKNPFENEFVYGFVCACSEMCVFYFSCFEFSLADLRVSLSI